MTDLLLTVPPENNQACLVRSAIRRWSSDEHVPEWIIDDALLVASELFSNAVRASAGSRIDISVRASTDAVIVETSNTGPGFDPTAIPAPSYDRPGGRGIAISKALGSLVVEQSGSRTTVRVALRTSDPKATCVSSR